MHPGLGNLALPLSSPVWKIERKMCRRMKEQQTSGSSAPPPPTTMGVTADQALASEEGRMQQLAEGLCSESSSHVILGLLKAVNLALGNQVKADSWAHLFLQAGGLPTVIHLLRGDAVSSTTSGATADGDNLRSAISTEAGNAVNWLVSRPVGTAELLSDDSVINALVEALRDAPSDVGRLAGANGLLCLAEANPAKRQAVAKAGVMWALLPSVPEIGGMAFDMPEVAPVWSLARVLLREEGIARRDLQQAICGAEADQTFTALYILNDYLMTSLTSKTDLGAAFEKFGLLDTLVATIDHESTYCIGAAAANMALLSAQTRGRALLGSSGAIPGLVRVIERGRPPADLKTGMVGRCCFAVYVGSFMAVVQYNNPTAMALAVLLGFSNSGPACDSILEAGGIPALVRLLKDSTCAHTTLISAKVIKGMLGYVEARPGRDADGFFKFGLCQAAVQALSAQTREVRGVVLSMLSKFCGCLSDQSRPAAMAELVAGNAVELTVSLVTEARLGIPESGSDIFKYFFEDAAARKRICDSAVADQLIKWGADLLPEADGPDIFFVVDILGPLLELCPCSIPAAIEANLIPGLVRALRKLQNPPRGFKGCHFCAIDHPLSCLKELLQADMGRTRGLWKAATKAGIVPLLSELLTQAHDRARLRIVEVSWLLLSPAPKREVRSWGVGLLRAIAQLLGAPPPALCVAAEMLYNTGLLHPKLFVDCHTWGIDDAVRQLIYHSDPDTAAAALQLNNLFFLKAPDSKRHSVTEGLVNRSASTSTPPPNFSEDQPPRTPSPKRPTHPTPTATSALDPTLTRLDGRHSAKAGSCASHNQGKLSVSPVPKTTGECSSRASASPGRCGVHVVWACARCGTTMEKCKLKECGACRSVSYCGKACQTADWPAHKATCKRLQVTCK